MEGFHLLKPLNKLKPSYTIYQVNLHKLCNEFFLLLNHDIKFQKKT